MITFFYCVRHLETKSIHYRKHEAENELQFLRLLDTWNARGDMQWQFYRCTPGYACPRDEGRYELT